MGLAYIFLMLCKKLSSKVWTHTLSYFVLSFFFLTESQTHQAREWDFPYLYENGEIEIEQIIVFLNAKQIYSANEN